MREACGWTHMKMILGTGDLQTLRNVYAASMIAMQAGADFIKTSTGKEPVNATLPVSLIMSRAIRDYEMETGYSVGFKPAGGMRTAKDALAWLILMKEELGNDVARARTSSASAPPRMLADIERQLEHHRHRALLRLPRATPSPRGRNHELDRQYMMKTMEYGPAPESADIVQAWLDKYRTASASTSMAACGRRARTCWTSPIRPTARSLPRSRGPRPRTSMGR